MYIQKLTKQKYDTGMVQNENDRNNDQFWYTMNPDYSNNINNLKPDNMIDVESVLKGLDNKASKIEYEDNSKYLMKHQNENYENRILPFFVKQNIPSEIIEEEIIPLYDNNIYYDNRDVFNTKQHAKDSHIAEYYEPLDQSCFSP